MQSLVLNRRQVQVLDARATEQSGIPRIVLMENAGAGCAAVLRRLGLSGPVVVCCGKGNNGGDGFVMARHLDARGVPVKVLTWYPCDEFAPDAHENFRILSGTEVPIIHLGQQHDSRRLAEQLEGAEWIVDALLGIGARGEPRYPLGEVIEQLNQHRAARMAIDVSSGLDCDTGNAAAHAFRADHTCTLAAPKPGLLVSAARAYVGRLHVVDIGVPRSLVRQLIAEFD